MPDTYTPQGGSTPQNLAQNNLNAALMAAPTLQPQQTQQDLGQAMGAQASLQGAYPTWARGATGQLQQQAGVPQLQQGISNLASLFPLYMADQGMQPGASPQQQGNPGFNQFANPNAFQQFTPSTLQDFTNANPTSLINNVVPAGTFGSGFSGFNTPGAITQAGGVVPQSASNLISQLSNAIGFENTNLVSPAMATASESYQGQMDMLSNLVQNLTGQQSQQYDAQQRALDRAQALQIAGMRLSGSTTGLLRQGKQDVSSFFDSVKGKDNKVSPQDYINARDQAGTAYGIDPAAFDKMFAKDYVNTSHYQDYSVDPSIFGAAFVKQDAANTAELNGMNTLKGIAQSAASKFQNVNPVLRNIPGASHVIPDLASANADLYSSLSALRQSAVGGRITQKEVNWLLDNRMPSALDTPAVMQAKVQDIQDQIDQKINNPGYVIGQSGNSLPSGGGSSGGSSGGGGSNDPLGIL